MSVNQKNENAPVRIWCKQTNCSNTLLLHFHLWKPVTHDAINAGWKHENGEWCCDKCQSKREEPTE